MRTNMSGRIGIRKLLLILVVAILIIAGVSFWLLSRRVENDVVSTGNVFASALANQDTSTSYTYLSDDITFYYPNERQWSTWVNFVFENSTGETPKLVEETAIEPGNVYNPNEKPTLLMYEFYFHDGAFHLPLVMTYTGDRWQVKAIESFRQP